MKKLIITLLLAAPVFAVAENQVKVEDEDVLISPSGRRIPKDSKFAAVREKMLRRTGGHVVKPGSQQGKFLILDAQSTIASTNISRFCAFVGKCTKFCFEYAQVDAKELASGDLASVAAKRGGAAVIAIVDSPTSSSSLLVSPDEKWATVNVSRLGRGLMTDEARAKFLAARVNKDVIRALVMICGVQTPFRDSPVTVNKMEDLDLKRELMPGDQLKRIDDYLSAHGLTKKVFCTYRQACVEGWAPPPENDFQRDVWKEVKEEKERGPVNGLKIEPPKK